MDPLRTWVTIAVIAIWLIAATVALVTANVTELGIITPVVMIVVGALFTYYKRNGNGNGKNGRNGDDDRWSHLP